MPSTPREVKQVLEQLLPVLIAWYENDTLGEVAVLHGGNEWQVEERPRKLTGRVKREVAHRPR